MKTLIDLRLRDEAQRYAFRFACEDCVHFTDTSCAHGYPAAPRRDELTTQQTITFCKEFELR